MKPSDFSSIEPMNCVMSRNEYEVVARNIMVILKRTGDKFRELSWDEYREHRLKDGNFSEEERMFFDAVVGYCDTPKTVSMFSPFWSEVGNDEF